MTACIRVGRVGGTGAAELGIQLDVAANIHDQNEWWTAFFGGQGSSVLVGLVMGLEHGLVPAGTIQGFTSLLGLQHKRAALVEVNKAIVAAAVCLIDDYTTLEHIGVVAGVVAGRFWQWQAKQAA
ncbi:hypothetical protein D3C81_1431780 [compost metagenome]